MSLIEMRDIHKSFYGVEVLHGVNLVLQPGSVHGADSGTVLMDDKEVNIDSPSKAREMGIAMIHQELSSLLEMSIAENMYLGREPGKFGFVDYGRMYKETSEILKKLGIKLDPKLKMKELRVADQQMVEIAKAISQNARIIIMDEPTSSITDKEVDRLFEMIQGLKTEGVGIIYISHKMDEIFRICDEMTVMRDGEYIDTFKAEDIDEDILIRSMVGLVGAGRTELMHTIFGMTRPDSGKIILDGQEVRFKSPKEAIRNGIAYVTEDRKGEGLILPMSVEKNITLVSLSDFVKGGFIQKDREKEIVKQQIENLKIKVAKTSQPVSSLSGGNQQKVVLAKWMISDPHILIFDEPTRGIDVGAKAEIYKIMCDYVSKGNSIIMVSSEMPEAMGMSDRIIVLSNHQVSGELERSEFDEEIIAQKQFAFMKEN